MNIEEFKDKISPFVWLNYEDSDRVTLLLREVGYKHEIFITREADGFEGGGGYDWNSLAKVVLEEKTPHLINIIDFDSEGSMFCAYAHERNALQEYALVLKQVCEADAVMLDLFSRAILDD